MQLGKENGAVRTVLVLTGFLAFQVLLALEVSAAQNTEAGEPKLACPISILLTHSNFVTGRAEEEALHKRAYQALSNLRKELLGVSERENLEVTLFSQFSGDENFGGLSDSGLSGSGVSVGVILTRAGRTNQITCVGQVSYRYEQTGERTFVASKNCNGRSAPAGWSLGYPTFQEVMKAVQLWRASL